MSKQLIIDGQTIEAEDGTTLLQACEQAGAEIPRFCYHERLSIAGNCRMCLVEVEGSPKPIASCAMGVGDLPPNRDGSPKVVHTNTPLVRRAREGVMEFLLINHPLDCPICDQGGECDLQDQAMAYGGGRSRFHENKRAVEEKYLGPLIKTFMNRCIHCTRCVRFMTEVAGVEELGAIGRGEDMEITTYLERGLMSELSANVNDLCPVGALTHRPWAYIARPWELEKHETIDVMDAVGSSIRVDTRGREVMRVLPRNHDGVNEEWISDKTRHVADGLRSQRIDQPYIRKNGRLQPATWSAALELVASKLKAAKPERVGVLAGDLAGAEEMFALKELMARLGIHNVDCRQDGAKLHPKHGRGSYLFNATIEGVEQADAVLLIGANPRIDAAVMNARLRRRWRQGGLTVASIGPRVDLAYPYEHLGAGPKVLLDIESGRHPFSNTMQSAKRPMVVAGAGAYAHARGEAILGVAARIALAAMAGKGEDWNPFNVLHTAASRVAAFDVGFVPGEWGFDANQIIASAGWKDIDVLYLLGADELDIFALGDAFVIYQGTHGDKGANRADVVLPGAAYTEKSATYVNLEGRVQRTMKAVFPPGDAKEDWAIVRALSQTVGQTLPYDTVAELRAAMFKAAPHLARIDAIEPGGLDGVRSLARITGDLGEQSLAPAIDDFYLTNPIARASTIMAEMSLLKAQRDAPARQAAE